MRIEQTGEILWRIRADETGDYSAIVDFEKKPVKKRIVVDGDITQLAPSLYRNRDIRTLGYPAERALADDQPISSIQISYPRARAEFADLSSASWLLFLFTLVFGFALRGVFRVTF